MTSVGFDDFATGMASFGHERFAVVGHDRGGRVAYRLALDHPERCAFLAVLDVLPVSEAWDRADARLALGIWSRWATRVTGQAMGAGHFFPEELPRQTAEMLMRGLAVAAW